MDRRHEILEAAAEILAEEGIDGLSVRKVAERSGIGASTLRHYFPNQRELTQQTLRLILSQQLDDKRIHDYRVPASRRLAECIMQFVHVESFPLTNESVTMLEGWITLVSSSFNAGKHVENLILSSFTESAHERICGWLRVLAGEGKLAMTLPIETLATLLLAAANGLAIDAIATPPSTPQRPSDYLAILEELASEFTLS